MKIEISEAWVKAAACPSELDEIDMPPVGRGRRSSARSSTTNFLRITTATGTELTQRRDSAPPGSVRVLGVAAAAALVLFTVQPREISTKQIQVGPRARDAIGTNGGATDFSSRSEDG